jgi:hypothetical protein
MTTTVARAMKLYNYAVDFNATPQYNFMPQKYSR